MEKINLNIDDYVRVKPIILKQLGFSHDVYGIIEEIYEDWDGYVIRLDSSTLDHLNDEFLIDCIKKGEEIFLHVFEKEDLELTERRDNDSMYEIAKQKIESRMDKFEETMDLFEDEEEKFHRLKEKWTEEFEKSKFCTEIEDEDLRESCNFIADTFMHYSFNYEGVQADEWNERTVKIVCLEWVPKKISADQRTFEYYGEGLIQFFKFLHERKYISQANDLIDTVDKIKDQIPIEASDSSNWGMAKSFAMQAESQGYDFSNQDEMNDFIKRYNENLIQNPIGNRSLLTGNIYKAEEDPFRKIGRNDKVNVKYENGEIIENIKFKKVEQDLKDGKCELLKK